MIAAFGTLLLLMPFLPPRCATTAKDLQLPSVVGPATGLDPVWLISDGQFPRDISFAGSKTLWIFKTPGRVRVQGREINTGATTRFQHQGLDGPIGDEMVIDDARRESVLPGGATRDLLEVYAFVPSYVFYPRPGCYQFTIEIEHTTRQIVLEIK